MANASQRRQRRIAAMVEQLSWEGCATEQMRRIDRGHRIDRTPTLDEYDGTEEEML
jgi:hypothetical protein